MNEIPVQNPENTLSENGAKLKAVLTDVFSLETPTERATGKNKNRAIKIIDPEEDERPSKISIANCYQKYYDKFIEAENDSDLGTALGRMMFAQCFSRGMHVRKLRNLLIPYVGYLAGIDVRPQEELGGMVFGPIKGMIGCCIITPEDKDIILPLLPLLAKTDGGADAIYGMVEGCFILNKTDRENLAGLLPDLAKTPRGAYAIASMVSEGFFGQTDKEILWKLIPDILSTTNGAHPIASMIVDNIFTLPEIKHAFNCSESQLTIIISSLKENEEDDTGEEDDTDY